MIYVTERAKQKLKVLLTTSVDWQRHAYGLWIEGRVTGAGLRHRGAR